MSDELNLNDIVAMDGDEMGEEEEENNGNDLGDEVDADEDEDEEEEAGDDAVL